MKTVCPAGKRPWVAAALMVGVVCLFGLSGAAASQDAEEDRSGVYLSDSGPAAPCVKNSGNTDVAAQLEPFGSDPSHGAAPQKGGIETLEEFAPGETGYYIVQFDGPIQTAWKTALADLGVEFFDYLPKFSFIIRMDPALESAVKTQDHVRRLSIYQPAQRISQQAYEKFLGESTASADVVELRVIVFPGEDLDRVSGAIEGLGATVESTISTRWKTTLRVRIPSGGIPALAAISGVKWIEPLPQWRLNNNEATDIIGVRTARDTNGLYGQGQTVGVCDSGLDKGSAEPVNLHDDFENGAGASRVTKIYDRVGDGANDVNSGHGTHVSGSVLGNGDLSGATPTSDTFPADSFAGMAPKAKLVFQAVEQNSTGALTGLPEDLNVLFDQADGAGADLHTNSWGAPHNSWYTTNSQAVDEYMWDHREFLILFAAGNTGIDKNSDGVIDPYSLDDPGTAKNCLTVGASENNRPTGGGYDVDWRDFNSFDFSASPISMDHLSDDPAGMAAFSGRGPTIDGRYKPDVVAPGTNVLSTKSSVNSGTGWGVYGDFYMYMGGTSMATPVTAGAAALLREYLIKEISIANPSAALVKAALINGATDITPGQYGTGAGREIPAEPVPNNVEGWGRVDIERATYPEADFHVLYVDENHFLSTGQQNDFQIEVHGSGSPLKANLVWTDYPGTPAAQGGLVNDLDVQVTDPSSTIHYADNALQHSSVSTISYDADNSKSFSTIIRTAMRFTAAAYPAHVASTMFKFYNRFFGIFVNWYIEGVDVVVYGDNDGVPGSELLRKKFTRMPDGWVTVELGLTIASGDFWIAVEKSGTNTGIIVDINANPTERSFFWNGSDWVVSTDTAYIRANLRGTDDSTDFDRVNNVVGLTLDDPETGIYTIRISGYNVPQGPQSYALVVSGDVSQTAGPAHVETGGATYATLQEAYNAAPAPGPSTLYAHADNLAAFKQALAFGDPKHVVFQGGCDVEFNPVPGAFSLLDGTLSITDGQVTVRGLIIQ